MRSFKFVNKFPRLLVSRRAEDVLVSLYEDIEHNGDEQLVLQTRVPAGSRIQTTAPDFCRWRTKRRRMEPYGILLKPNGRYRVFKLTEQPA